MTGVASRIDLWDLVTQALSSWAPSGESQQALRTFMRERVIYLFEQRGFDVRNIRAVVPHSLERVDMVEARKKLEALAQMSGSEALRGVATLFKRVKNITKDVAPHSPVSSDGLKGSLKEPAELALLSEVDARAPGIRRAAERAEYREAFAAIARHHLADGAVFVDPEKGAEIARAPEFRQHVAQLGLKQDDEGDEPHGAQRSGDVVDGDQVEPAGEEGDDDQDQEADEHLRRARAAHQHEEPVKK